MRHNWHIFCALIRKKWTIEKPRFWNDIINKCVWAGCTILVSGYLLQAQGISHDFGAFQFAGTFATVGIFNVYDYVAETLSDIETTNILGYHLTLPCSSWTVFAADIVLYGFLCVTQTLAILPLGKLILWDKLSLTDIAIVPAVCMLIISSLFLSVLALWLTSVIRYSYRRRMVQTRLLFPAWFLGGFQFSFFSVWNLSTWGGCLMALNPITYITEGMRGALVAVPSLSPWLCMGILLLFGSFMFWDAMRRLRQQLDFVA